MSVEKIQRDLTNLFNYPSDPNPTTQADYINAVKNWVGSIVNLVDCGLWQPETTYEVGAIVRTPSLPVFVLKCITAGTSDLVEPDYTDVSEGDTIQDNNVEWVVCTLNTTNASTKANADASNIGVNAETDNSEDWGDALGGGAVASGEKRLVTGDTVFKELAKYVPIAENAGFHNSIYRGKNLGADVTDEQWDAIKAGTFDDLFIGDYWPKKISYTYYKATADTEAVAGKTYYADVNGTALDEQPEAGADISEAGYCELVSTSNQSINFRIAGFDYCLNTGDANTTAHHIVIVPDTAFLSVSMNKTNTTEGGYVGSDFYTGNNGNPGLVAAKAAVNAAFGSEHILSHKIYLDNAVTSGRPSAGAWYASTVELMNEHMVYGGKFFEHANSGTIPTIYAAEKGQLPLFAHEHSRIGNRGAWWLRSVVSGSYFAFVHYYGFALYGSASYAYGVRPYFAIYKS